MVDLKDLIDLVMPKADEKKGGTSQSKPKGKTSTKNSGLDDLISGAITSLKNNDDNDDGLDDLVANALSSLSTGDNAELIMKILKGALTSTVLTSVVKSFTSNMAKKPDVVENLTSSLEKNNIDQTTIDSILKSVKASIAK